MLLSAEDLQNRQAKEDTPLVNFYCNALYPTEFHPYSDQTLTGLLKPE